MTTRVGTSFMFRCPVHGDEDKALCFRAFDKANLLLWHKYTVIYVENECSEEELQVFVDEVKQKTQ